MYGVFVYSQTYIFFSFYIPKYSIMSTLATLPPPPLITCHTPVPSHSGAAQLQISLEWSTSPTITLLQYLPNLSTCSLMTTIHPWVLVSTILSSPLTIETAGSLNCMTGATVATSMHCTTFFLVQAFLITSCTSLFCPAYRTGLMQVPTIRGRREI